MSQSLATSHNGRAAALLLLVLGNVAVVVAMVVAVLLLSNGRVGHLFEDGGPTMYPVVLLAMVQVATGLAVGMLHLRGKLSPALLLLLGVPCLTALAGTGGAYLGAIQIQYAMPNVPAEHALALLASGCSIAEVVRWFALALAGCGLMSVVVAGAAGVLARPRAPATAVGLLAAIVALALALGVAITPYVVLSEVHPGTLLLSVCVAICGALTALALYAAGSLRGSDDEEDRGVALDAALMCGGGTLLAFLTLGMALLLMIQSGVLSFAANAPPADRGLLVYDGLSQLAAHRSMLALGAGVLLLLVALALGVAAPGLQTWLKRQGLWGALTVGLLGVVVGANMLVDDEYVRLQQRYVSASQVSLPPDLVAAPSASDEAFDPGLPLLAVKHSTLYSAGKRVAEFEDERATRAALAALLQARSAQDETHRGDLINDERYRHSACQDDRWPRIGLAIDVGTPASELLPLLRTLLDLGVCRVSLLAQNRAEQQATEAEALNSSTTLFAELVYASLHNWYSLPIELVDTAQRIRLARREDEPAPLGLLLRLWDRQLVLDSDSDSPRVLDDWSARDTYGLLLSGMIGPQDEAAGAHHSAQLVLGGDDSFGDVVKLLDALQRDRFMLLQWVVDATDLDALHSARATGAGLDQAEQAWAPETQVLPARGETVIGMGSLRKEDIRLVISKNVGQIRSCYERALMTSPALSGKVVASFTIVPDGRVSEASVSSSTLRDTRVEGCIINRVKRWRFPKPVGGGIVKVNYPFVFKAVD